MAKIKECMSNKCKYWNNYICTNTDGIKLNGDSQCRNFEQKDEDREDGKEE